MRGLLLLISVLSCSLAAAQTWEWRMLSVPVTGDTITFDSLSVISSTFKMFDKSGNEIPDSLYSLDPAKAKLRISAVNSDSVTISYRVFPLNFSKIYRNKVYREPPRDVRADYNVFKIETPAAQTDFFQTEGLNKSGSVSRGVTFGNSQDLTVNSNLDLKLSGRISEEINVLAAISDDNIPIQPEGNTQQLQDFDQVFIKVYDDNTSLIAGDFQMTNPPGYFMTFFKRAQGASVNTRLFRSESDTSHHLSLTASGAVSKGKFARNIIQGVEGNQGPYRLQGNNNELFIIILSGTERIYIDGELLVRGQDNDYVIDYNTAEVTFTARRLITKDKRIVAEFQYTDRTYARSLLYSSAVYTGYKGKVYASFFNEQDSKNQPLQQDLGVKGKAFLAGIGDNLSGALFPSIDTATFKDDVVLYALRDTVVNGVSYDSILVFSSQPDSAQYTATFSVTGEGNGNYILLNSTANGKVYKWVAPIGGIPQGNYEPVTLLVTPKKHQMATVGGEYLLSPKFVTGGEVSYSDNDLNTFSNIDNSDNQDLAFRAWIKTKEPDTLKPDKWVPVFSMLYEQVNDNFIAIERFRPVEFERDWNITGKPILTNQRLGQLTAGIAKNRNKRLLYSFSAFHADTTYLGVKQDLFSDFEGKLFKHTGIASALFSDGFNESTEFLRWRSRSQMKGKLFSPGVGFDAELNERNAVLKDSLLVGSYLYHEWEIFVTQPDSVTDNFYLGYKQRSDYLPSDNSLNRYTFAENYSASYEFNERKWGRALLSATYRRLEITNSGLTSMNPEETFLGRFEHTIRGLKGAITWDSFYETGSGLEQKKQFSYVEVAAGQGVYAYVGDLNENGLKDLNEFEISRFPDQARYIRVFTPTLEYIRTYSNQLSQSLLITPERVWLGKKGLKGMAARFANQTAFRVERKTTQGERSDQFNPFAGEVDDSSLVSTASSLRNVLFFNRTSQVYGLEHSWQESMNKILLVNGFETRANRSNTLRGRLNVTRQWMISGEAETGRRTSANQFSPSRNFDIIYYQARPKLTYQPGTFLRLALSAGYQEKENITETNEDLISKNLLLEFRYSKLTKGNVTLETRYVLNEYNGQSGTIIAYEMLEGLQPGSNVTWSLIYQRQISDHLQLNLSYQGRISELSPAVHTGGVQVRAFF